MATRKRASAAKGEGRKAAREGSRPAGKGTWGGRRPGAGRPRGSGSGPSADARRNRVAVMFSDRELALLRRMARKQGLPVATLAHHSCMKALERLR